MTTSRIDVSPGDRRERVSLQQYGDHEHQERIVEDVSAEQRLIANRLTGFVYLVFSILECLVGLRFMLKLIGANPINPFAHVLYQWTDLILKPFITLVLNPTNGNMVFEITTLIAMLVYGLLCWGVIQMVRLIFYQTRTRMVTVYNKEHH